MFEPPPPFTAKTAALRVRAAENAWNTCAPDQIFLGYSLDSVWRSRTDFLRGRAAVVRFLSRKWTREMDHWLANEPRAFGADRIAVRFAYAGRNDGGNSFRSFGNENWKLDATGLIGHRYAAVNDLPIREAGRRLHWNRAVGRPADHPGLSELGF